MSNRDDFEKWALKEGLSVAKEACGSGWRYTHLETYTAYNAYKAAQQAMISKLDEPSDLLMCIVADEIKKTDLQKESFRSMSGRVLKAIAQHMRGE